MKSERWNDLRKWFYENHKTLPEPIFDALEILMDERESEGDDYDEDDEEEWEKASV